MARNIYINGNFVSLISVVHFFPPFHTADWGIKCVWKRHFRRDKRRSEAVTDIEVRLSHALMFCSADGTVYMWVGSCKEIRFHPPDAGRGDKLLLKEEGKVTDVSELTGNA